MGKRLSRTRATKVGTTRWQSHREHVGSTMALQGTQPSGLVKYAQGVAKTETNKVDARLVMLFLCQVVGVALSILS